MTTLTKRNKFPKWSDFFSDRRETFQTSSLASLDIKRGDQKIEIWVDLPGVEKENIDLSYQNEKLTIEASRQETKSEDDGYFHEERRFAKIRRSLYLPGLDPESIEASLEEGVLYLTMKLPESRGKRIKIESR